MLKKFLYILLTLAVLLIILVIYNKATVVSLEEALEMDTPVSYKTQLIETELYPMPAGGTVEAITVIPDLEVRTATWPAPSEESKGTILIMTGYSEFIEKYYETIQDLLDRNWNVVCFDWRGQGLSTKMLPNSDKGYIENFKNYQEDAEAVYQQKVKSLPRPHNLLAHSMGGHLGLRELQDHPNRFDKAILCAPMQKIVNLSTKTLKTSGSIFESLGFGQYYVAGGTDGKLDKEYENLTRDTIRFKNWTSIFRKERKILMGGATWSWSRAAAESMNHSNQEVQIKKIKTPTYIASPLADDIIDPSSVQSFPKINSKIKIVTYPNAEHEILQDLDVTRDFFFKELDVFYAEK